MFASCYMSSKQPVSNAGCHKHGYSDSRKNRTTKRYETIVIKLTVVSFYLGVTINTFKYTGINSGACGSCVCQRFCSTIWVQICLRWPRADPGLVHLWCRCHVRKPKSASWCRMPKRLRLPQGSADCGGKKVRLFWSSNGSPIHPQQSPLLRTWPGVLRNAEKQLLWTPCQWGFLAPAGFSLATAVHECGPTKLD